MTIKQMEALSGMTRANIRFYEAEGLLTPARRENGYRDYSQDDLENLKRIKLLRTLHIPLEEIRSLYTGEQTLSDALDRQLEKLEQEGADILRSRDICHAMRADGVQYGTLDAQRYLDAWEQQTNRPVPVPQSDAVDEVRAPWRRFFARTLDISLYGMLWDVFWALAFHVNILARSGLASLLDSFAAIGIMVVCEPALLALFGTTAGKWVLGLRVTDSDGRKLDYRRGLDRTWTVFVRGMGLYLPIYDLVRLWKNYKACQAGEPLDWESDSALVLKDEKRWRVAAYIGIRAVIFGMMVLAIFISRMPKHRGDITVAEFCENYNRYSRYYHIDDYRYLDEQGQWVHRDDGTFVLDMSGGDPNYTFFQKNGVMTGVEFTVQADGGDAWVYGYQNEMTMLVLSFVRAQKESGLFSRDLTPVLRQISDAPFESFDYTVYGVRIRCQVELSGYTELPGLLIPQEGVETSYSFTFTMEKI